MISQSNFNASRFLKKHAKNFPTKTATILANGKYITFGQMEVETQRMAQTFKQAGIQKEMRVAMFVRPGLNFVPSIFALFRLGAIPVFIDPGMKRKHMLSCVKESQSHAMVGIPLAHAFARLYKEHFSSITIKAVLTGSKVWSFFSDAHVVQSVEPAASYAQTKLASVDFHIEQLHQDSPAMIIFTSGSTGAPKGVEITHGILNQQTQMIRETYHIGQDEIDLVPFPLFALFSAAWGITSVIPRMNPGEPSKVNGQNLANLIQKYKVTHASGSPAIWKNLFEACLKNNIKLPSVKRILMAGAPVSEKIIRAGKTVLLTDANIYTPYGATEALPLTSVSSRDLLEQFFELSKQGAGTCVGKPLSGIAVKIIPITNEVIEFLNQVNLLPPNTIGEVIVQGDIVTRSYFNREPATRMAKIAQSPDNKSQFWHRMGDLGYLDEEGRLWFCGRKDHRITLENQELYPVTCEGIFNQHPNVFRSALVQTKHNNQIVPTLVIQTQRSIDQKKLKSELLALAQKHSLTQSIEKIVFKKHFPLDTRHNIKIDRIKLGINLSKRLLGAVS